ncbi:molybdate transport repressor ModE-like protein [Friedmanniella endophytica]|uniref:Molybdate transport repressor ModE-like protein n=1 Tax=Microlunatus kandeliicorticis TaxID=1759536 RepID=A0A7W3IVA3_9ACTN|nr:LysR substrate-binding domain-containing protein [Microlunatus kandeliicorticis]MBA8795938.1 molybdate transport repressor ModE-like protein [Microlunatus kandeliicorticis]
MGPGPHLPPLESLALLTEVARTGSIGGAARAVGLTQQSASERLAGMERQVGVPLLHRGARGTGLTAAGRVLVEWSARLLAVAGEVDAAIGALRDERDRTLRIAASMTVAEHLLPRWLAVFRQQRSTDDADASVSLRAANSAEVVALVASGGADLGFVEGAERPRQLRSCEIADDELVLVVAPGDRLARRRRPLGPAEVAALALTSREPGSGTREVVDQALAAHGLRSVAPAVEVSTATAARESVLAGGAPAFLSRATVDRDLAAGSLVRVATTGLDTRRTFRAVWVGDTRPPAGPVRQLVAVAIRSAATG